MRRFRKSKELIHDFRSTSIGRGLMEGFERGYELDFP